MQYAIQFPLRKIGFHFFNVNNPRQEPLIFQNEILDDSELQISISISDLARFISLLTTAKELTQAD